MKLNRLVTHTKSHRHRKTRLLFTTGGYRLFGKERVVLTLIRGLAARGYDIHCLTNAWSNDDYCRELREMSVPYTSVYLGWIYPRNLAWTFDTLRNAPRAYTESLRVYRQFKPDLVLHDSVRTVAALGWRGLSRNLMGVHDYATTHSVRALLRVLDWQVSAYVPVSRDVRHNLLAAGIPDRKIHPVANPAEFDAIIRGKRPAHKEELAVGIVGQVIERKGHHVLVEAMARIRERRADLRFRLKVFGEGLTEYADQVRALAKQRDVISRIDWCGYKRDKDEIYSCLDFVVVPTVDREPFGLVAIEPAAYGLPVIASAVGGLPEIVRDGVTGYLVSPSDPDALADRMIRFLGDPDHARRSGEAAFADYSVRFSNDRFVDQYVRIIDATMEAIQNNLDVFFLTCSCPYYALGA